MVYRDNIAYHVLRATAPNPDQPGALNYGLWPLTSLVLAVNTHSDLDTFKWDIFYGAGGIIMPPALPQEDPHSLFLARQDYVQPLGVSGHPQQYVGQQGATMGPPYNGPVAPRQADYSTRTFNPPRPSQAARLPALPNEALHGPSFNQPQITNSQLHSHPQASHAPHSLALPRSGLFLAPTSPPNGYPTSSSVVPRAQSSGQPLQAPHPPRSNNVVAQVPEKTTFNQPAPKFSPENGFGKFSSRPASHQQNNMRNHLPTATDLTGPRQNAILPIGARSRPESGSNSSAQVLSTQSSTTSLPVNGTYGSSSQYQYSKPISEMPPRCNQLPTSTPRSDTSGTSAQTPQSTQRAGAPNSVTKAGKPIFRFSKEQRAVLERSATMNMSPGMDVKRQLAQQIGVDVKRVHVSLVNP